MLNRECWHRSRKRREVVCVGVWGRLGSIWVGGWVGGGHAVDVWVPVVRETSFMRQG